MDGVEGTEPQEDNVTEPQERSEHYQKASKQQAAWREMMPGMRDRYCFTTQRYLLNLT